jgi:multicomponent Na+:H+ antiporter subunit D
MTIFNIPPFLYFLLGGLILPLIPRPWRPIAFLVPPVLSLFTIFTMEVGTRLAFNFMQFELVFLNVTNLNWIFGIIFSLISIIAGIYALHMQDLRQQTAAAFYATGALCVTFAGDFLTLYLGWEIMAVASTFLIWARDTPEATATGIRYFLFHIFGGLLLLAGILLHVSETGTLALTPFTPYESLAAWLILLGVAVNVAIPPLHAWLAESYPMATVTGAIFMSALTTKSAVYVLASLFAGWQILIFMGVLMALYGVVYAVLANDIRGILAYHIISQVGYMVAGVGIGTEMAINGTTAHAFSHILYKALLFMGAGVVLHTTGKSKLTELGGLYSKQKLVFWLYMIGAFSISGFPFFNGFISKSMIVAAAGYQLLDVTALLLILASIGTFLHTGLKLPYWTWFGQDSNLTTVKEPKNMVWAMFIAAALCTFFGIYPWLLYARLPYPEVAYNPFQLYHFVEMTQLLVFTYIAFWVFRNKLAGEKYLALDFEYFYRLFGKMVLAVAYKPVAVIDGWLSELYARLGERIKGTAKNFIADRCEVGFDSLVHRKIPKTITQGGNSLLTTLRADAREISIGLVYLLVLTIILALVTFLRMKT